MVTKKMCWVCKKKVKDGQFFKETENGVCHAGCWFNYQDAQNFGGLENAK